MQAKMVLDEEDMIFGEDNVGKYIIFYHEMPPGNINYFQSKPQVLQIHANEYETQIWLNVSDASFMNIVYELQDYSSQRALAHLKVNNIFGTDCGLADYHKDLETGEIYKEVVRNGQIVLESVGYNDCLGLGLI